MQQAVHLDLRSKDGHSKKKAARALNGGRAANRAVGRVAPPRNNLVNCACYLGDGGTPAWAVAGVARGVPLPFVS